MTDFDKKTYWKNREAGKSGQGDSPKLIVAVHSFPDWPAKPTGKKRRAAHQRKEQLAMIADLNGQLFIMDHPQRRHAPARKNCFYCQEPNIYRDGVCAGHWDFLYKNMSNKQRMIEKAYHRKARAEELQRKREQMNAHIDNIKQGITPPKGVTV